jgi:uncharacterized repeat protein (TIGR01451 family)
MLAARRSMMLVFVVLIALSPGLGWSRIPALPTAVALAAPTRVAYVYNTDTTSRDSFKTMLELRGFAVDLVPLIAGGGAETFDFTADQAILIGDDTGTDAAGWAGSAVAINNLATAGKNIIGIGYGGSHLFNALQLSIGRGNALPGTDAGATAVNPGDAVWSTPNAIPLPANLHPSLYWLTTPLLGVLNNNLGPNVTRIGSHLQNQDVTTYPLIAQRIQQRAGFTCDTLWGFRRAPNAMAPAGQDLFENIVRGNPCAGRVAYVYNTDTASRDAFQALFTDRGITVDLVTLAAAETFNFANDLAIVIGDDTGLNGAWGTALAVSHINGAGKPIVGVGEGGYAYFGQLSLAIGFAHGAHVTGKDAIVVDGSQAIYAAPYPIATSTGATLALYSAATGVVEISVPGAPPAGVSRIGRTPADQTHYPLISQRGGKGECYALWGFRGAPSSPASGITMTALGKDLFVNMVLGKACGEAPSASADLRISKTSAPTPATAGLNMTYKLTVSNAGPNTATGVKVTDPLPAGVTFVSVTPSQGVCGFVAGVICHLGSLAPGGAVASVTIVVTPQKPGKLTNSASVSSPVSDPNSANNSIAIDTTVNPALNVPPLLALPYYQFVDAPIQAFPLSDLSIFGIEITQGIQCFDTSKGLASCANNSLPVVAKKDATARIYLHCTNLILASCTKNNVPVRLHIFANGVEYIANTNGKATPSINQATHDDAEVYFNVNFSNDVVVSFYAEVDPNHAISESSESNNRYPSSGTIALNFRKRGTLNIVGDRLRYHPSGYSGQQYAGGTAVNGVAASWYSQVLPMKNNGINYWVASGYKDWTTNLGGGDGQHALIQSLNLQWLMQNTFSWLFGTGSLTGARHVYGWAPSAGYSGGHADMPIYPHAGGLGVVGIGSDAAGTDTDNPGSGTLIFGHELTHDYNVLHTNTSDSCGSSDDNADFPYASSSIQEFGFNPITGKIYDPASTHDLMSYCPSGGSKQGWISPFTWNKMYNKLAPTALAAAAAPTATYTSTLVFNATISNGTPTTGQLGELHKVDAAAPLDLVPSGAYSVELRNGATTLISQTFNVSFESEYGAGNPLLRFNAAGAGTPTPQAGVSFLMPWVEGTTSIVLLHGATVLDSRAVSAGAPSVLITSPSAPVSWPAGSTQTLSWSGADPDGGALTYSVFYSNDGGEWELLESGLTGTSLAVNVDALAGGANTRFRVVANDGVNVGFDETNAPISVPDKLPAAAISEPGPGAVVRPGDLLLATGMGSDLEDGMLPDEALEWSSDRQGALGSGPSLAISTLQPGPHTITLTVHDSAGQAASASVQVFVGTRVALPVQRR